MPSVDDLCKQFRPDLSQCLTLLVFLIEFLKKNDFKKSEDDKMLEPLPSMQRVKSTNCKVSLALFVGDWTHVILFKGLYHMLSCCIVTC